MTGATWEYANKLTHSSNATYYEAFSCVPLCISLVGVCEIVLQKIHDPISQESCPACKIKKLTVENFSTNKKGKIKVIH